MIYKVSRLKGTEGIAKLGNEPAIVALSLPLMVLRKSRTLRVSRSSPTTIAVTVRIATNDEGTAVVILGKK